VALAALLVTAVGHAQERAERLHLSDRLTGADPMHPSRPGHHFKQFDLQMAGGVLYLIDLKSSEFDAFLRVEDADGKVLAEDDDSGGSQNARLLFRAPASGTYRIVATSFEPDQTGKFTLSAMPSGRSDVLVTAAAPTIAIVSSGQIEDTHGYVEYRLAVRNESPNTSHRAAVFVPQRSTNARSGYTLRYLKRSVTLGPGETQTFSLWQPNLPMNYGSGQMDLVVDNRISPVRFNLPPISERGSNWRGVPTPASLFTRSVLLPSDVHAALNNRIQFAGVGQPPPVNPAPFNYSFGDYQGQKYHYVHLERFRVPQGAMDLWSRHWLGYSSYDCIMLHARDVRAAPEEVRTALWRYVECGGSLVVLGSADLPVTWQRARQEHGGLTHYHPGFGQCVVAPAADVQNWEPDRLRMLVTMWEQSARPFRTVATPDVAHERFRVVDDVGIPIQELFLAMLVFCILIGPVNILVLSWLGRRIWLLWTVPTFSLLTCAAVVAFMSATEERHGVARVEGLTLLDQTAQRAISIGWLGLYSAQTPGDGLHFSWDTELSPHLRTGARVAFHAGRTIDWSHDQNLTTGWLTARTPAYFLVRTTEVRPEHVTVDHRPDGRLSVTNGLGAGIRAAWIADADGIVHTVDTMEPGASAAAVRTKQRVAGTASTLREVFDSDWLKLVDNLAAQPDTYLRPGCYIAVLDAAPFIPQGLAGATQHGCRSVVYGIMQAR
jgi:hypothetical protein